MCKVQLKNARLRPFALFMALFLMNVSWAFAQLTVTGHVKSTSGDPLIGVNVVEKGTTNGTVTDMDGNFILDVPSDCTLQISYIGFNTREIKVTNQTNDLTVSLKEDTETLDEVVVVGFGSQKKANLTGSVSTVKMDEVMGSRPLVSASDALQGTMPGLMVSNNGNAPGKGKSFHTSFSSLGKDDRPFHASVPDIS